MRDRPMDKQRARRFERLAWPMMPVVLRTAQVLTRQPELAQDLAQDTMVKAMRAIDTYQDGTDIKAWLLTILRRTHIDHLRAQRNRPGVATLDTGLAESLAGPEPPEPSAGEHDAKWEVPEDLMRRFEDDAVIDAMRALPDEMRWTLLLVDVEGLDHAAAATVLGVAAGTIKSRSHRGRALLRDRLYGVARERGWVG